MKDVETCDKRHVKERSSLQKQQAGVVDKLVSSQDKERQQMGDKISDQTAASRLACCCS